METDIKWDDLTKDQRNILMWPDLLTWNEPVEHVIKRNTSDSKLGLKIHSVEDISTNKWYHIVSHVEKNNSAANANIMPYVWITNVGEHDTRNLKHNELAELFNNMEMTFRIYTKKPDDPLTCFESEWPDDSKSTVVTFKIKKTKEFIEKLNLGHFYSKERNFEEKDRILIWKVGQFSSEESTELLKRGDRLLEINGKAVESKKLKDIYKMFSNAFPGKVDAKFIKIRNGLSSTYGVSTSENLENPLKYRDMLEIQDMDYTTANEIYRHLDHEGMSSEDLVSAFDHFTHFEGADMRKSCKPNGGKGLAEMVITRWANDPHSNHNIKALKTIVENRLKRKDVLELIEIWEEKFPCRVNGRQEEALDIN
ncbi:uncharacterized protein LOC124433953 isoform X3 [Xenia sp. Carnegie-2017]|uniref:uncharacterized protein LOC124433953 isoform X3 n=1 Tax=Xenia sp. Carnegie-2017 TaxID=2897299 RepID=UPI001F043C2B|nr:uncharacterized protein LOC124433953 isoform X3 [Xenia sp. Carnegie-2017]